MTAPDDTTGVRRLRLADDGANVGATVADPAMLAAAYRNLFDISHGAPPFRGGLDAWATGRVTLSLSRHTSLTLTRTLGRGAEGPNRRILDHVACHQILSGTLEGGGPGGTITASAGDMVLQDLLLPAAYRLDDGGGLFSARTLWIPRVHWSFALAQGISVHGRVLPRDRSATALVASGIDWLQRTFEAGDASAIDGLADTIYGQVLRAAVGHGKDSPPAAPPGPLTAVLSFIDKNLPSRELNPEMIAGTFGLSRASLYRLFEPLGGVTAYIHRQRLHRAFADLTNPVLAHLKVAQVGRRWGYDSESAFSRAFKALFGVPPAACRVGGRRTQASVPGAGPSLTDWL